MRARALLPVLLVACGPAHAPRKALVTDTVSHAACRDALVTFADMQLDRWRGLPSCTADDLIAALGAATSSWRGPYGMIRRHPGRAATAKGIEAELDGDRARHIIAFGPTLAPAAITAMLGAPEERAPSRLFEPLNEQWIWATRGLTIHVGRDDHVPRRVYGYAPMTLEAYRGSRLYDVEAHEYAP